DALVAEAGPDLAVALAVERRLGQHVADVPDQLLVRAGSERATPPGSWPPVDGDGPLVTPEVDGGAGQVPEAAEAGQAVLLPRRWRNGLAYLFRLLGTKGRSARHRWVSSSLSMVSSPTLARSRAISSSRSSAGRLLRAAWPPARKSSLQADRVAAVTPSSRESSSRSSPRRRRRTVSVLRRAEKRPRSSEFEVLAMVRAPGMDTMLPQRDVQRNPGAEETPGSDEPRRSDRE